VRKHLEVVVGDVGHGQDFELRLDTSTGDVDGEEHGKCNDTSNQTGNDGDLEEAQEEVAIHGVVLEHIGVRDFVEGLDPVEESSGEVWRTLAGAQRSQHRSWAIVAREPLAEEAEEQEEDYGIDENGNEHSDNGRGRCVLHVVLLRAITVLRE